MKKTGQEKGKAADMNSIVLASRQNLYTQDQTVAKM